MKKLVKKFEKYCDNCQNMLLLFTILTAYKSPLTGSLLIHHHHYSYIHTDWPPP